MQHIKNIIFDLGGVIIDIDVPVTFKKFAEVSGKSHDEVAHLFKSNLLFERHETCDLTDDQFRNEIRRLLQINLNDKEIDQLWNALLFDIPEQRIDLIMKLNNKFRTFLLSNTNNIHFIEVENILRKSTPINSFQEVFEKVYLSHEVKLRKPHQPIYEFVLNDSKLIPNETLFIDDNADNIAGAASLGIQTIHLQPSNTIIDHLQAYV
jgi:putative hydrolase of the HAD superfamily